MEYVILFAILLGSAIIELYIRRRQSRSLYWLLVVVLILFAGTRYDFGRDYYVYKEAFYNLNLDNYAQYLFEPLFTIGCILLRPMGFNFFIFIIAFVSILSKAVYIQRHSRAPIFSLLTYFAIGVILYEMGQIRQALAMSIVLWAFNDCLDRKKILFYCKIFIAFSLHYSAIIILPCYIMVGCNISYKKMLAILIVLLPFAFIDLSQILITISSYISLNHIALKILDYSSREQMMGINISLILRVITLLSAMYVAHKKSLSYRTRGFIVLYFYGICIYLIFNSAAELAMRGAAYFKILEVILYPILLMIFENRSRIVVVLCISTYLAWTIINLLLDHPDAFLPYQSFLFA